MSSGEPAVAPATRIARICLALAGGAILAGAGVVGLWSRQLATVLHQPPALDAYVAASMLLGALYLGAVWAVGRVRDSQRLFYLIFAVGLAARLVLIPSRPLLEVDYYRYLWDGAVTAHGVNPYAYSPQAIQRNIPSIPAKLRRLAHEPRGAKTLRHIIYPQLTTIYPPVAEGTFAVAYWLGPLSVTAWRVVLLAFDLMAFTLLARLLTEASRPRCAALLYWWNPLLIQMTYVGAHLDVIVAPLVLAALLYALRGAPWRGMFWLAMAVGAKLWPVVLLPVCWQAKRRGKRIGPLLLFAFLSVMILLGYTLAALHSSSGASAYAQRWEDNDCLFRIQQALWSIFAGWMAPLLARATALLLLAAWIFYLARRPLLESARFLTAALFIVAAVFLLSPTEFPWYYLWLVPFLALRPQRALLLYTMLLPLYYYHDIWLEHLPVLALLAWDALTAMGRGNRGAIRRLPADTAMAGGGAASVAVVIPALNEERSIAGVLAAVPPWVKQIIVVDNGSTDRTAQIALSTGAQVVYEPRRGYGAACLAGMAALQNPDVVVFLDADGSDDPRRMDRLVGPIARGDVDMVIGSRVLGGPEPGALSLPQRRGNALACWLMRLFWGVRYTDLGPFRAIRHRALRRLAMDARGYGWTIQMQLRTARLGLEVAEVPVPYRRRIGISKISGTWRGVLGAGFKILSSILTEAFWRPAAVPANPPHHRLIIFARYPTPGRTKTRLMEHLGAQGAAALQDAMTRHTLAQAEAWDNSHGKCIEVRFTGTDGGAPAMAQRYGGTWMYTPQGAGDLGRRIWRAMRDAFQDGAGYVLIIGADSPGITPEILQEAFVALKTHDLVLGPARDGGYYLIGLGRPCPELFTNISWGSRSVLSQTLQAAELAGLSVRLLGPLADVDHPGDLPVWDAIRTGTTPAAPPVSVIIPTLNEESNIAATIASAAAPGVEVLIVDGGSTDQTVARARDAGAGIIHSLSGRGRQMNAGAAAARGGILLFLHSDTLLPPNYPQRVCSALAQPGVSIGAFSLRVAPSGIHFRIMEQLVYWRSRYRHRPYGDQALFLHATMYYRLGGFPEWPILEDLAFVKKAARAGRVVVIPAAVITSARRWLTDGFWSTTLRHQLILVGQSLGIAPERLSRIFRRARPM